MDKGSNRIMFVYEIKNFTVKIAGFPKIMTISTDLDIFQPACLALSLAGGYFYEFCRQRRDH